MTAPTAKPERPPFQFTLRQLLGAMAFTCVAAASVYWLGPALGIFAVVCTSFFTIAIFLLFNHEGFGVALVLSVIITLLIVPLFSMARVNYRWAQCQNNLRNIALALQNYHDDYGSFPPAYIADENGEPIHSWRVLILPYLEFKSVYDLYRFDEAWNGPHNTALAQEVGKLRFYECPSSTVSGEVSYFAVTGPQTIWPGATSTKMSDIKDGPANTILLVEAHNTGIHWMEPRDLDFAALSTLSSAHHHGRHNFTNAVFADGHHQALPDTTPAKSLRAALTISGQEKDKLPTVRLRQ